MLDFFSLPTQKMPKNTLPEYKGTMEDRLCLEENTWIQKLAEHQASGRPVRPWFRPKQVL